MATGRALIFSYYNDSQDKEDGTRYAKCQSCGVTIKGKQGVTSNFVTHLKVRVTSVIHIIYNNVVEKAPNQVQ